MTEKEKWLNLAQDLEKDNFDLQKQLADAQKEIERLSSQKPPCSATCYHHQTHPCEKCGRISGYLPVVMRDKEIERLKTENAHIVRVKKQDDLLKDTNP